MERLQAFLIAAAVVTLVAAAVDLRRGQIPNWLTLGPLAAAVAAHAAAGWTSGGARGAAEAAGFSVLGAVACGAVPLLLWRMGGIGGGDVKLLVALGAILRASVGMEAELYAFVAAALFAPAKMAYEGKLLRVLGNTLALAVNPFLPAARRRALSPEMMTEQRFGPAIFAGTCAAAIVQWR